MTTTPTLAHMPPQLRRAVLHEAAVNHGVCVRPIAQRVTDMSTGQVRVVAVPCGSTRAKQCPSCAERARQARYWQCREGWHLTDDPDPGSPDDDPGSGHDNDSDPVGDDGASGRVIRSTRHRDDMADFPVRPHRAGTLGQSYESKDGKRFTPSMFITLTLPSFGRVNSDGVPRDPDSYQYELAALDAMHFSRPIDRFIQNLRRCAGYKVQYFAAIEPQKRGAPHVHMAIRGTLPRADVMQVIAATYHQVWWPTIGQPAFTSADGWPTWDQKAERYVDPTSGCVVPTWEESLPGIDDDPAYVVRFGSAKGQDVQGFIAGDKADRRIGYLTKYLTRRCPMTSTRPTKTATLRMRHLYADARHGVNTSTACTRWHGSCPAPRSARTGCGTTSNPATPNPT